jgi:DDRGK domain-containing protein 1
VQEDEGSLQVTPEKITQLVEFIKRRKVVMVEDVAQRFQMLTKDVIERIAKLEEQGRLSGITDDRGKYIFVTPEEFEKVAQSIEQRGRVSRQDLLKECNRIIRL